MERQDRYRPTVQKLGHFRVPCVDTHNALTTPICTCCYKGFYTFLCGEDGREIFGTYLVSRLPSRHVCALPHHALVYGTVCWVSS
jgi:hypothetical protein